MNGGWRKKFLDLLVAAILMGGVFRAWAQDNGIGIEPRFHTRVFDLFEQLDPTAEGSGVGLALAKRIIEFHHGKIWVTSHGKNRGTTFCLSIPSELIETGVVSKNRHPIYTWTAPLTVDTKG
jgi:signal transduction histidine kinase